MMTAKIENKIIKRYTVQQEHLPLHLTDEPDLIYLYYINQLNAQLYVC